MPDYQTINLAAIEKVATALEELNDEVIYIGGAVISLYITDKGAEPPRPTKDIDISVKISTYAQMDKLRVKLASKNIHPAPTEKILYRYTYKDILIDFIPYEATPLGPTNSWLKPGFKKAYPVKIGSSEIKILPVSLFLATKWEAFESRGTDPRMSHDFEDIIYVIDNNLELLNDVKKAEIKVQKYLKDMCETVLSHSSCNEIIECHISPFTAFERRQSIVQKLKQMTKLA